MFLSSIAPPAIAQDKATYTYASRNEDIVNRTVARKISAELGINLVIVNYPDYSSILNAVESGKVDFASNVTFTKERGERFIFSAPTNVEYVYFYSKRELDFANLQKQTSIKGFVRW